MYTFVLPQHTTPHHTTPHHTTPHHPTPHHTTQMEVMKSNTGFKCKEFENQVSTFKKKWAHLRQSGNEDDDDMMMKKKKRGLGSFEDIQLVKEMTSEFEDLKKCKNTLRWC